MLKRQINIDKIILDSNGSDESNNDELIFEDLIGKHLFQGVDLELEKDEDGQDMEVVYFKLDNIVYKCIETRHPDWGYYLSDPIIVNYEIKNKFQSVEVEISHYELSKKEYEDTYHPWNIDGLIFTDIITNEVILRITTLNNEDEYPYVDIEFIPENMIINKKIKEIKE